MIISLSLIWPPNAPEIKLIVQCGVEQQRYSVTFFVFGTSYTLSNWIRWFLDFHLKTMNYTLNVFIIFSERNRKGTFILNKFRPRFQLLTHIGTMKYSINMYSIYIKIPLNRFILLDQMYLSHYMLNQFYFTIEPMRLEVQPILQCLPRGLSPHRLLLWLLNMPQFQVYASEEILPIGILLVVMQMI